VIGRDQSAKTEALIEALVSQVKIVRPDQVVPIFRILNPATATAMATTAKRARSGGR
jgi:hypothetical protein